MKSKMAHKIMHTILSLSLFAAFFAHAGKDEESIDNQSLVIDVEKIDKENTVLSISVKNTKDPLCISEGSLPHILYNTENSGSPLLLKNSWYLIAKTPDELKSYALHLMERHPKRSKTDFAISEIIPSSKEKLYALMTVDEDIENGPIRDAVSDYRSKVDSEVSHKFIEMNFPENMEKSKVALLAFIKMNKEDDLTIMNLTRQCRTYKFFTSQFLPLAEYWSKIFPDYLETKVIDGHRHIFYKNNEIWPIKNMDLQNGYNDFVTKYLGLFDENINYKEFSLIHPVSKFWKKNEDSSFIPLSSHSVVKLDLQQDEDFKVNPGVDLYGDLYLSTIYGEKFRDYKGMKMRLIGNKIIEFDNSNPDIVFAEVKFTDLLELLWQYSQVKPINQKIMLLTTSLKQFSGDNLERLHSINSALKNIGEDKSKLWELLWTSDLFREKLVNYYKEENSAEELDSLGVDFLFEYSLLIGYAKNFYTLKNTVFNFVKFLEEHDKRLSYIDQIDLFGKVIGLIISKDEVPLKVKKALDTHSINSNRSEIFEMFQKMPDVLMNYSETVSNEIDKLKFSIEEIDKI